MRLELADGQHAELRERLTYGQAHGVRAALVAIDVDKNAMADLDLALVTAYVSSWNVLDVDGNAVPLDQPELAADAAIQSIALAAMGLWKGTVNLPKAGGKTSPSTRREPASRLKIAT